MTISVNRMYKFTVILCTLTLFTRAIQQKISLPRNIRRY